MRIQKLWMPILLGIFSMALVASCGDDDGGSNPVCGDGIVEGNEACDLDEFAGPVDCGSEGFVGGEITCAADCTIDISGCANCGDDIQDADEECDGSDFGTTTCESLGYDAGLLSCQADCTINEGACTTAAGCTSLDLSSIQAIAQYDATDLDWVGIDIIQDGADYYWIWYEFKAAATTGSVDLGTGSEASYTSCVTCVSVDQCTDPNCDNYVKSFFATAGTMNVSALGITEGSAFTVSLTDLELKEWDLFGDDIEVSGGDCLMDSAHTTDATVSVITP